MKALMQRTDGQAFRETVILYGCMIVFVGGKRCPMAKLVGSTVLAGLRCALWHRIGFALA
jgi:hypothetical protein